MIDVKITGVRDEINKNNRRIAALRPSGTFGRRMRDATTAIYQYVIQITHVDTGALKKAHRMEMTGLTGRIYIDPTRKNPRTKQLVITYGPHEHARGGTHAFYDRAIKEVGPTLERRYGHFITR